MLVTMNDHELQRFSIIQDVLNNKLKRRDAISILGISYRHLSRILKAFKELGVESLAHGNRGKPSSNLDASRPTHQRDALTRNQHYRRSECLASLLHCRFQSTLC